MRLHCTRAGCAQNRFSHRITRFLEQLLGSQDTTHLKLAFEACSVGIDANAFFVAQLNSGQFDVRMEVPCGADSSLQKPKIAKTTNRLFGGTINDFKLYILR